MSYTYEQVSGKLRDEDDNVIGIGYSGAGDGKNNPLMEHVVDVGPIPCGTYTIKGPPFNTPSHGPFVLKLVPDTTTRARIMEYGRDPDSFLFHGDSISHPGTASQGCLIQDRQTRETVNTHLAVDNTLIVVDVYSLSNEVNV